MSHTTTPNTPKRKPHPRRLTHWLIATLLAICLLQIVTIVFVTAQIANPSAKVLPSIPDCAQDYALRPKFPRPFPDGCLQAPIRHLKKA